MKFHQFVNQGRGKCLTRGSHRLPKFGSESHWEQINEVLTTLHRRFYPVTGEKTR